MSTVELNAPEEVGAAVAVGAAEFDRVGMIRLSERAVRAHGPAVTMMLPGGRLSTVLGAPRHGALWAREPDLFVKDLTDAGGGAAATRAVLGSTLLAAAEGAEWAAMRAEVTALLGRSKAWFRRPLPEATATLVRGLVERPDRPLLEHCIEWAVRATCDPLIGAPHLEDRAEALVARLTAAFLDRNAGRPGDTPAALDAAIRSVMDDVAAEHGPHTVAALVLAAAGTDAPERLRAVVGGLLIASLHINALSLFWLLVLVSREPALQARLAREAASRPEGPDRPQDAPLALASVREAQRLRPVVAFIERTVSRPVQVDSLRLPKGRTVLFSPWLAGRDPDAWPDPTAFDPDRFLCGRPKPGAWIPFGVGPRTCPGVNVVLQQVTFALSVVAARLELAPDPDGRPGDLSPVHRVNLEPRGSVALRARPRP